MMWRPWCGLDGDRRSGLGYENENVTRNLYLVWPTRVEGGNGCCDDVAAGLDFIKVFENGSGPGAEFVMASVDIYYKQCLGKTRSPSFSSLGGDTTVVETGHNGE